jgi:hypothetical protein
MKRILPLYAAFLTCGMLTGCGSDTYEGLISETIQHIKLAGTDVGNIKSRVKEATDRVQEGKKLDLSDAIAATKQLKIDGEKTQDIKRRIELIKANVTDDVRKANAEAFKDELNKVFSSLLKQREELREALAVAERIDAQKTAELRSKIVEAEGPFEALSR